MVTIPKPGKMSTDLFWNSGSGVPKVHAEGRCRMCQRPAARLSNDGYWLVEDGARPLTRHHLVPVRWFMSVDGQRYRGIRNANANIIPLCRYCHDLIEFGDRIARRMLRRLLTQQEVAFAVRLRGISWLNREYPLQ